MNDSKSIDDILLYLEELASGLKDTFEQANINIGVFQNKIRSMNKPRNVYT